MAGLLSNPLINLGTGLMSVAGPFTHPGQASLGLGLSRGLASLQQQTQAEQEAAFRKQQMAMAKQKMAAEAAKLRMAQEAQRRQAAALPGLLAQLPEGERAKASSLMAVDPGAGMEYIRGLMAPAAEPKGTGAQQDYERAKEEGFAGSFLDYKRTVANLKEPRPDPIAGLAKVMAEDRLSRSRLEQERLRIDIDAKQRSMAAGEEKDKAKRDKALKAAAAGVAKTKDTLGAIDTATEAVSGWSSGPMATILGRFPWTDAGELKELIRPIESRIATDQMDALKKLSATGATGFGQLSNKELGLLQSAIASLETEQKPDRLREALGKVRKHYLAFQAAVEQEYSDALAAQGRSAVPYTPAPAGEPTTGTVRRRFNPQTGRVE